LMIYNRPARGKMILHFGEVNAFKRQIARVRCNADLIV
jgi:hypothetical protein